MESKLRFFSIIGVILFVFASSVTAAKTFDIRKYGAKGDGKTLNTNAINKAIQTCSEKGGGVVLIPQGIYLTGTIFLKSDVSLLLKKGAVIKGTSDLSAYYPFIASREMDQNDTADQHNWNRALILGKGVKNVHITGAGIIDGDHVFDPEGEEKMRGPHTILLGESHDFTLSGITINNSANYAFMAYDIENATFQNLTFNEGWDGIHIRGGKNILIRNSFFYTGDDAIAGGYWKNMVITECHINSSCNGIRMIMPATGLTISHCTFTGPGKYPHRTSKERKRNNMLSAILLQPGGWGKAPGRIDDIHIHDVEIKKVATPLMIVLNEENEAGRILVEKVKASAIGWSASSVESWCGGYFEEVVFRDISVEYIGCENKELKEMTIQRPHVDSRQLPCWGWFAKNVKKLTFQNVELKYTGKEVRPTFYFDSVKNIIFDKVACERVNDTDVIVSTDSGSIKGKINQYVP
ncbi:glycoside hydrolase family 28 protein [Bacteroides bouchesdurhonensis]|uniref:glycoside hydrolase family 28 protein n=1 Tax=Bacteroides bouchesdurhonensis TaxID=1841855 RepID=UPI0011DCB09A|nr:glycosyl hydrolase family 28-related protein [Bacteroides bouchesdurhonensis]